MLLPLPRALRLAAVVVAVLAASISAAGCGTGEADRGEIARDLGRAYAAYVTYVAEPAAAGKLGPSTRPDSPTITDAAAATRYASSALDAAREEAVTDDELATLVQKTDAARASLTAVANGLSASRANRPLIDGGLASLESLNAAARDRGIAAAPQTVTPADLLPAE